MLGPKGSGTLRGVSGHFWRWVGMLWSYTFPSNEKEKAAHPCDDSSGRPCADPRIILETDAAAIAGRVSRPKADTTDIVINEQTLLNACAHSRLCIWRSSADFRLYVQGEGAATNRTTLDDRCYTYINMTRSRHAHLCMLYPLDRARLETDTRSPRAHLSLPPGVVHGRIGSAGLEELDDILKDLVRAFDGDVLGEGSDVRRDVLRVSVRVPADVVSPWCREDVRRWGSRAALGGSLARARIHPRQPGGLLSAMLVSKDPPRLTLPALQRVHKVLLNHNRSPSWHQRCSQPP